MNCTCSYHYNHRCRQINKGRSLKDCDFYVYTLYRAMGSYIVNHFYIQAVSVQYVLLSSSPHYIFYLRCSCGGDGNWSINVKSVCDLEGPLKMTNHRSHQLGSERWRAREPSREKMKTKEDCRPICVKVRARVMNTPAIWSFQCLLPSSCL